MVHCGNAQNQETALHDLGPPIDRQSHVFIDLDSVSLDKLLPLIEKQTPIAVSLSEKKTSNLYFLKIYGRYNDSLVVFTDRKVPSYISERISTVEIPYTQVRTIVLKDSLKPGLSGIGEGGKMLLVRNSKNNMSFARQCMALWNRTGKLPNFIEASESTLFKIDSLTTAINAMPKVFGMVRTESGMLSDVTLKNFRNSTISGFFSFPILTDEETLPILIPYKAGYRFSPDIIYTSPENQDNLKDFTAFHLDINFGLTEHFTFEKTIQNTVRKNSAEILTNNVDIKPDSLLGRVGFFENRAYIDAGLKSKEALQSNFTITAWAKPTVLDLNNSILGKGDGFVLKIHDGFLTFTMAGIKDYISRPSPVPLNQWSHIALVYSKIDNILLFYINGKETDRIPLISDYEPSNYNILIGSNLWEEFFVGYLGEIKIWERELNASEILSQYQQQSNPSRALTIDRFFVAGAIGLLFLLSFLIWWKSGPRKIGAETHPDRENALSASPKDVPELNHKGHKEQILCFGGLKIYDQEGTDLAKKLSPKLKEIFLVILLHSLENGKGISTKHLTELLWPGMTSQSAKNTRGTNIQNLRSLLASSPNINLNFVNKCWRIEMGKGCYFDYRTCLTYIDRFASQLASPQLLEKELPTLLAVLQAGRFLANSGNSWLDPFIEKFSNLVIGQCIRYSKMLDPRVHGDLLFQLAEVIYLYDDLNEAALRLKLQVLVQQGKLRLAHAVHGNFAKLYQKLYMAPYTISFEDIVSEYPPHR